MDQDTETLTMASVDLRTSQGQRLALQWQGLGFEGAYLLLDDCNVYFQFRFVDLELSVQFGPKLLHVVV